MRALKSRFARSRLGDAPMSSDVVVDAMGMTLLGVVARLLAFSAALIALPLLALVIYRLFFHPLARVPGPRLAAISNIWQARYVRDGRARELGKVLHQIYGPVVRVGPNEVWFNSAEAFGQIYRTSSALPVLLSAEPNPVSRRRNWIRKVGLLSYVKHLTPELRLLPLPDLLAVATALSKPALDWQLRAHFPDTLDLLSEFDVNRYKLQRRLIGPVYLASNVKKFEPAVGGVIKVAISELKALNGAEVDLKQWMHILAVECLGAVVLSWSPGYIRNRSDGGTSTQSYLGWKRKSLFGLFPTVTKLSFLSKNLSRLFSNAWGVTFKTPKNFKPFFTVSRLA